MNHDPVRLSFRIDAYKPDTLPMFRLAEYMAELATIVGEKDNVHFVKIMDGSAQLIHDIEYEAYPKIESRARAIQIGEAPADASNAYRLLNKKLAEDNTFATYSVVATGAQILPFPGVRAPRPMEFLPVDQPGSLDGVIIGIGGRAIGKNTVPVVVDSGDAIVTCTTTRGLAKQLGHYLLDTQRRFHGMAQWQRDEHGAWTLRKFSIQNHEELDETPLADLVRQLRAIPSDLSRSDDPLRDIILGREAGGLN